MGRMFQEHSDLCGCERCAAQADSDNPRPVYDVVQSDEHYDCGCPIWAGCDCYDYD